MKIYLNQDGQPAGPFSREEIQDKIYSGELSRSMSGCVEGSQEWKPLGLLLESSAPPKPGVATAAAGLTIDQLRDPKEKTALMWLYIASVPVWILILILLVASYGTILLYVFLFWLFELFGVAWFSAHLRTNAVRVSETQLPEIHQVVRAGCQRLGMECPEVYVMQHNIWNAFATKLFQRRVVVLFSGAVDSILLKGDMQQLSWVVGHELGHHWAGHLDKKQKISALGGWLIWLYLWHSRRRELTCDRVGLYLSGSLRSSQLALANLTTGAQLASRVNPAAMAAQWQQHRGEFFVKYRTMYSNYPQLLARMDHLTQAGQEFGMAAT